MTRINIQYLILKYRNVMIWYILISIILLISIIKKLFCFLKVPPKPIPCPEPDVRFGGFSMKVGGRMSEFWCEEGWKLAPATSYAMCVVGKWNRDIPVCVRPGCDKFDLPSLNKVKLEYEMDEAIARFECIKPWPELELIGNAVLSCDGAYWNGTLPECIKPPSTTVKPSNNRRQTLKTSDSTTSSSTNIYNHSDFRTRVFLSVCGTNFVFLYYIFLYPNV